MDIPAHLPNITNGLLGIPGPSGDDFVSPQGVKMQTCAGNRQNVNATYDFGETWKVATQIVSKCAIDVCPFQHPFTPPTTLAPDVQSEVDRLCAGLTGAAYESCRYDYLVIGPNATLPSHQIGNTITLQSIVLTVSVSVQGSTVTVWWSVAATYSTYLLQYSSGNSQFWTALTASNPTSITLSDGTYVFRVCVSDAGSTSPWMYSVEVNVRVNNPIYVIPTSPVVVGGSTGSTIYAPITYYDGSGPTQFSGCNCADGPLSSPASLGLSIRVDTTTMVVIISANVNLDGMILLNLFVVYLSNFFSLQPLCLCVVLVVWLCVLVLMLMVQSPALSSLV